VKACRRYEVRLKSTRDEFLGDSSRTVKLTLTLLEDHARFNGMFHVLLPYSGKNARELLDLLKVIVEKAKLYAEAEKLR